MKRNIRKVLLIVNLQKPDAESVAYDVKRHLSPLGIVIEEFHCNGNCALPITEGIDLAICLGGDGTVLYSARNLAPSRIPILAVNLGAFGFIAETAKDEWQGAFAKYVEGDLGISARLMLDVSVVRNGNTVAYFSGLNDAVVTASGISKIVRLSAFLTDVPIGRFLADGIIVATPTGSTAYSVAAGGPIVHPEMDAFILNPICPFTLSNRPLVVSSAEIVRIEVDQTQRTDVNLTVDGQIDFHLKPGDSVQFHQAPQKALIIRSDKRSYYEVLRTKLNWSGGPDA